MTKVLTSESAATDSLLPTFETLEDYEAAIAALAPRAWWSPWNSAYRTDVGGKCSQINDRSGGNFHMVQATAGSRPTVTADYWGALNGVHRDAIVFDGATDLFMQTAGNVFDGTTVWSVFVIMRALGSTAQIPLSSVAGTALGFGPSNATTWRGPGGATGQLVGQAQNVKAAMLGVYNYPGAGNVAQTIQVTDLTAYEAANGLQSFPPTAQGATNVAAAKTAATLSATGSYANPGLGLTAPALLGSLGTPHVSKFNGALAEAIVVKGDLTTNAPAIAMLNAYAAFLVR